MNSILFPVLASICTYDSPIPTLQALVTRGAKPLGAAQLVTKCSSVSSPSGTPYLLLERASAILHDDDEDDSEDMAGGGSSSSGSNNNSSSSAGASAASSSSSDRNVMAALQEALNVSGGDGGGGMGMYYLGLQVSSSRESRSSMDASRRRNDGSEG